MKKRLKKIVSAIKKVGTLNLASQADMLAEDWVFA